MEQVAEYIDGTDGLPPRYTFKKKDQKKRKANLQSNSAPLTPESSGISMFGGSSRHAGQQPSGVATSTSSDTTRRRSTVSDTGHLQDMVDVSMQMLPMLNGCDSHSSTYGNLAASSVPHLKKAESTCSGVGHSTLSHQQAAGTAQAFSPRQHNDVASQQRQQQQQQQPGPSASTSSRTLQPALSLDANAPNPPPSLWQFFHAEATPHDKYPTADVLWRQTERDRVYNFLLYVPYQLERILAFGTLLCLYSFLGTLTILPLRCLRTLWQQLLALAPGGRSSISSTTSNVSSSSSSSSAHLPGAQLYDLVCVLLLLGAAFSLSFIRPGVIYYWMKDITSEFLKIQVIFTALEILDKILSNFGVDVLEALSGTCTLFTRRSIGLMPLISDLLVAFLLITTHGSVLMCQAMVFAVTMNSKANALLALMIATNFVELKGQVYKRTDTNKLWTLACQDIVERFELLLVLSFVVVEDSSNSGTWVPAAAIVMVCGRIFMWEVIIDIAKHAVVGKFNDIRPGIYREYMRDLCSDSMDKHSHNTHKLVGFCPMGPAALCLRMLHTLFTLKSDGRPDWHIWLAVVLAVWLGACLFQVVLGFSLKWLAYLYVRRHALQAGGKTIPRVLNVAPAGVKLAAAAAKTAMGAPGAAANVIGTAGGGGGMGDSSHAGAASAGATGPAATVFMQMGLGAGGSNDGGCGGASARGIKTASIGPLQASTAAALRANGVIGEEVSAESHSADGSGQVGMAGMSRSRTAAAAVGGSGRTVTSDCSGSGFDTALDSGGGLGAATAHDSSNTAAPVQEVAAISRLDGSAGGSSSVQALPNGDASLRLRHKPAGSQPTSSVSVHSNRAKDE